MSASCQPNDLTANTLLPNRQLMAARLKEISVELTAMMTDPRPDMATANVNNTDDCEFELPARPHEITCLAYKTHQYRCPLTIAQTSLPHSDGATISCAPADPACPTSLQNTLLTWVPVVKEPWPIHRARLMPYLDVCIKLLAASSCRMPAYKCIL